MMDLISSSFRPDCMLGHPVFGLVLTVLLLVSFFNNILQSFNVVYARISMQNFRYLFPTQIFVA